MIQSKKIQAVSHFTHTVFDIVICNGKVVEIKHWRIRGKSVIECKMREDACAEELFRDAVGVLCHDENSRRSDIDMLLNAIKEDEEYLKIAKEIMMEQAMVMAANVALLVSSSWLDYLKQK